MPVTSTTLPLWLGGPHQKSSFGRRDYSPQVQESPYFLLNSRLPSPLLFSGTDLLWSGAPLPLANQPPIKLSVRQADTHRMKCHHRAVWTARDLRSCEHPGRNPFCCTHKFWGPFYYFPAKPHPLPSPPDPNT